MFDFKIDQSFHTKQIKLKELYDVIIVGGGPGAINAAIYSARNGLSTLIVAYEVGGQLLNTNLIDNYLGFHNISGEDLNNKYLDHLNHFEVDKLFNFNVSEIKKEDDLFVVRLGDERITRSRGLILATGGSPRKLNVPGEKEFTSKGVSYCVICDGAFYGDKELIVVGGGNSALEAALDLSKYALKVHIVQNLSNFTGDKVLVNKVKEIPNITYQFDSVIHEIKGHKEVESVVINQNGQLSEKKVAGIFITIGIIPSSDLVKDLVELNRFNEVVTNNLQETSLPGLYAIGDVTNYPYKQVIVAASQGAVAALALNKYLNK